MKKIVSSVLIIGAILPAVLLSRPSPIEAQSVPVLDSAAVAAIKATTPSTFTTAASTGKSWLETLAQQAIRFAAKQLLAKITQSTINWINQGFHGSPLFLENPESFFKDIAKSEVKFLVDMIGYDPRKFPFGQQTALCIIDSYKSQLATNAQYTLSKVINDPILLGHYQNDFNYGGWNGFLINTQYPQNNYLGFNMIIGQNLQSRLTGTLQSPAQKVQTALQQGMGFLSPQECKTNQNFNKNFNEFNKPTFTFDENAYYRANPPQPSDDLDEGAAWNARHDAAKAAARADWSIPAKGNVCPPYPDGSSGLTSTTPGSVAAHKIMKSLDIPLDSKILAGALGGKDISDSIGAIMDALLNKIVTTGLNELKNTANPAPTSDIWGYYGNTLGGNNIQISDPDLSIQQNVSVGVGESTTITMSGGNGHYVIQGSPIASIATASKSGNTLTITGRSRGSTAIVINDTSTPSPKTATIAIDVSNLTVNPNRIVVDVNNDIVATISGGTPPYRITRIPDRRMVMETFTSPTLIVSGLENGNTSLEIQDSATPPNSKTVQIRVGSENLSIQENVSINVGEKTNITIH